ncbi:RNA polymerase sigma factor [Sunxiuqinia elliptica]|uniref:RNA polymerase sigma-70 factor (ECF subfamily) n=1 Tax=Sunxiuqinia elliptica TaxID=655355 RepID=A0A4R6GWK2_9BACT|nr:sigma-70 family RNA polymerase sigma factor [Sunxiuqinia elliptica]TDN99144.1 RNA polymerase sigma-70 factor (ECF subfamily) [Sunxiuqinia elliptica]TDO56584.1 RNA polymerase sigma-70 factor (ECF subfamily) [Sunxiuqinia elliptica]
MFNAETLNDNMLVQKFIDGDQFALEELINRHKNRVFTYIVLIVKNHQLAEDIFQDTFIKVIRSLKTGKYTENGKFVSWVLRIAHNLIIDHFRKEKLLSTTSNDDTEIDLFNSQKYSDENIEDRLVYEQITEDVRKLIDLLPEDQRQVIIMRHYMGLSFKEISKQTDVSINTALGRMRYALINLRKIIEKNNLHLTKI